MKKNRLFAILPLVCLLISCCMFPAPAEQPDPFTVVTNDIYGYQYTVHTDAIGQTVRRYTKAEQPQAMSQSSVQAISEQDEIDKMRSVLTDIGMDPQNLENLSDEDLLRYAQAEQIVNTTTYTRTTEEGETFVVDESTAVENSRLKQPILPEDESGAIFGSTEHFLDEYMKMDFVIVQYAGGVYSFTVSAYWLTIPKWKMDDTLGGCASNLLVVNNTRKGWYSYRETSDSSMTTVNFTDSNFENTTNGIWNGTVAKFNLPNKLDYFYVTLSYEMVVSYPNQTLNFSTTASYDHTTFKFGFSPSIGISSSGLSFSIGWDSSSGHDRRTVEFPTPFTYTPED